jgi:diguanylate cyclase (GGDEF)-like protein/PAS domain S-box-containing protein
MAVTIHVTQVEPASEYGCLLAIQPPHLMRSKETFSGYPWLELGVRCVGAVSDAGEPSAPVRRKFDQGGMTRTIHERLRQQIEECFKDSASLPEPVQAVLTTLEETYGEAELELKLADRLGLDLGGEDAPEIETAVVTSPGALGLELDALPDIVFVLDRNGTILKCRGGDPRDLTIPRDRLIGKSMARCRFGDVAARFAEALESARATNKPVSIDYQLPCDNGLARFQARLRHSSDGRYLVLVRNMTEQAEAESAVRRSEQEYRGLIHSAHAAMLLIDPTSGSILECNPSAGALYRLSRDELIGKTLQDLFIDVAHIPDLEAIASKGGSQSVESWHRVDNDSAIMVEMLFSQVSFRGSPAVLSVNREILAAPGERPAVRNMISMLKATFDATADGILVLDPDANFVTANRLFAEMWKIPDEMLKPGREQEAFKLAIAQVEDPASLFKKVEAIHKSHQTRSSNVVRFRDGRFFECVSMPQLIAGQNVGRVWSFRDITGRVQAEERIRHHAFHDSLTGLPNRALFHNRLSRELGRAKRNGHTSAVLLIDLDRFKTINDTLGHAAGDELLIEVAKRLHSRKRDGDTIARLGGDEFVFIISRLRYKEDVAVVAEQALEVLRPPIRIAEHELHISASIGIAVYPDDGDEGTALMKCADVALYRAKELGRDNYQIYEPRLAQRAMERMILEKDLRQAIHDREFMLQYQPQYDLKTRRMRGVEALVRWRQGELVVPPNKFIPIAEECGLIVPLGRWVLEEAVRQCAEFNRQSPEPIRICVNVSAMQIQRPDFANEVSKIMQEAGLPLKQLVVELTESALMQNPQQGSWAMAQLEQMGIGIAMDDFGTGHSSLTHLSLLPISMIKIDRAFVTNCSRRKADSLILSAIITMGHALDLKVLAEGVETEAQAEILRRQGCDEVQGFLYGRPVSAEQLIALLKH